jgi:predicted CopG family antitoxin
MHDSCMATKTITLEMDAYERLRMAKRSPSESFSSVVRRAVFPGSPSTAGEILAVVRSRLATRRTLLSEEVADRLDKAQANPRSSESHWGRG